MAVSRIASDSADGSSVTVPTHQVGDLLVFWAFRDGSSSTPTKPADITQLESVTSNSAGSLLGWKLADTTTETSGTWTNATEVAVVIYRGVDQTTPVGDSAVATGASTTLTFPALTMTEDDGTSWVAGLCFHRSTDTTLSTAPTGMTNFLNEQNGGDEVAGHDTNAGVASWSEQTAAVSGTSSGWAAYTVEIRAAVEGVTIVPADIAISLTEDSDTINQNHVITTADIAIGLTEDNDTIAQNHIISLSDIAIGTSTDNTTVSESGVTLVAQDITLSTSLDVATISQNHIIVAQDINLSTLIDNTSLGQLSISEGVDKTYLYKVYSANPGTFMGLWTDVISDLTFTQEINSPGSAIEVELSRNTDTLFFGYGSLATESDDQINTEDSRDIIVQTDSTNPIGDGSLVDLNLNVDIYVFYGQQGLLITEGGDSITTESDDSLIAVDGAPNGRLKFSGYISRYQSRYGQTETTLVTILSHGDELDNYVYESSGNTTIAQNSKDPSDILTDAIDQFNTDGGLTTYSAASVLTTETIVSYTFRLNTYLEVIRKVLELAPADWYWTVDYGQNLLSFKSRPVSPDHIFYLGKHIESLNLEKHIEGLVNKVYFSGGDTGGGVNLFKEYENTSSISSYRQALSRISDNRVTLSASAEIISESEIDRAKDPRYRSTITILASEYPGFEDIEVGNLIGFRNFGNFIDELELQVVSLTYAPDEVTLTLDSLLPSVNKRVEDIKRQLNLQEYLANPNAPT